MSKSIEHPTVLDAGGHPYDGRLAHLHCNTSAGARYGNAKRRNAARGTELATSADLDG